jgi:hypothetical protein
MIAAYLLIITMLAMELSLIQLLIENPAWIPRARFVLFANSQ